MIAATVGRNVDAAVRDQGTGIAPDALDKLFNPFFTTKPTGSGLGLSMARDVMTRIGGEISARNRPEGGAEFVLRFPAWKS